MRALVVSAPVGRGIAPVRIVRVYPARRFGDRTLDHLALALFLSGDQHALSLEDGGMPIEDLADDNRAITIGKEVYGHTESLNELDYRLLAGMRPRKDVGEMFARLIDEHLHPRIEFDDAEPIGQADLVEHVAEGTEEFDANGLKQTSSVIERSVTEFDWNIILCAHQSSYWGGCFQAECSTGNYSA